MSFVLEINIRNSINTSGVQIWAENIHGDDSDSSSTNEDDKKSMTSGR